MSNPFPPRRTQGSKLLQFAEYTSTAASVLGVFASALSQQVVYVAAPLSLTLCLSLVNRRRFEQQSEHRFNAAIAQIDQSLLDLDQRALEPSVQRLTERVTDLDEQIAAFQESRNQTAIDLSELRLQLSQLQECFATTQQRQNATLTNLGELEARLSQLNVQLTAIQQRQVEGATSQTGLDAQLAQLRENLSQEIQAIQQQLQALTIGPSRLETLQQEFLGLTERISQLQERWLGIEDRLPPLLPALTSLPPADLMLNLGIDFGTSFTKVCFRDVARDRSEIVTFMDEMTRLEEALIPSKIGILSDGRLIAGLTASEWKQYEDQAQTSVKFIKMRLADMDLPQDNESWRLEKIPELENPETVENLCAYYLSRIIVRAQTWIRNNKLELVINHTIGWSANVGVPVEYYDSPALKRFQKVLSLAWLLTNEPQTEEMTMQNLRDRMQPLRARLEVTQIDCHAIPEIAAEAWALINSREVDTGFYVLFDVGDGTLDGSSFRYWNDEGERKVDFYVGKVDPLGVTAFCQQLAEELAVSETDIKNTLWGNLASDFDLLQTSNTKNKIQKLVAMVVYQGYKKYQKHTLYDGFKKSLNILIGGGGGEIDFYKQAITSTYSDFKQASALLPKYEVRSLPTPKDLETNGMSRREFHRFAVAYGLSIPEGDQPEIRLPSQMVQYTSASPNEPDLKFKDPKFDDMQGAW